MAIMVPPEVAHAALGPDKLLSMGKVSVDAARGMPDRFKMDRVEVVDMTERREIWNERVESLTHSEGENDGEIVDGMHATCAHARGQHDELEAELTHLVYLPPNLRCHDALLMLPGQPLDAKEQRTVEHDTCVAMTTLVYSYKRGTRDGERGTCW